MEVGPSEKKIVTDPITGHELTFSTSTPVGDTKIYLTHSQWTSDGQWLIFRSNRVKGEAMTVNEKAGELVQVTQEGFTGALSIAQRSMNLYFMREAKANKKSMQIVELNLATFFKWQQSPEDLCWIRSRRIHLQQVILKRFEELTLLWNAIFYNAYMNLYFVYSLKQE